MEMATDLDIAAALKGLADCFPNFTLTKATVSAYCLQLHDIDAEVLRAAAAHCASTGGDFFPSVSRLRDAAFAIIENSMGIPCAADAWGEVSRALRKASPTRCPTFSHPAVKRAVDGVGGWYGLCLSENAAADRARFLEAYEQIVARDREQRRMLPEVRQLAQRLQDERAALSAGGERLRLGDGRN